jgi:hypothetical protein
VANKLILDLGGRTKLIPNEAGNLKFKSGVHEEEGEEEEVEEEKEAGDVNIGKCPFSCRLSKHVAGWSTQKMWRESL